MIAEFLRDAAVLVLVFVPLELATKGKMSWIGFVAVVAFSAGILALGIILERSR